MVAPWPTSSERAGWDYSVEAARAGAAHFVCVRWPRCQPLRRDRGGREGSERCSPWGPPCKWRHSISTAVKVRQGYGIQQHGDGSALDASRCWTPSATGSGLVCVLDQGWQPAPPIGKSGTARLACRSEASGLSGGVVDLLWRAWPPRPPIMCSPSSPVMPIASDILYSPASASPVHCTSAIFS